MFIVTVEFVTRPPYVEDFHQAILDQARNSLNREPECRQFDVCADPQDRARIFLYEVYTDHAAFKYHLKTVTPTECSHLKVNTMHLNMSGLLSAGLFQYQPWFFQG